MREKEIKTLLLKATTDVEFSFNHVVYKQMDGVAMGSLLAPVLADIFVGHREGKVDSEKWPVFYNRFVDNTFTLFSPIQESEDFFQILNNLHPALRFTVENEDQVDFRLWMFWWSGLTVGCFRSVYCKPTFTA